jgi:hypothetical protein
VQLQSAKCLTVETKTLRGMTQRQLCGGDFGTIGDGSWPGCSPLPGAVTDERPQCGESPESVQANVAKAKSEAVEENAKADEKVKQVEAEAAKDRADAEAKAADKSVGAVVDSALTQAEGETKVALAKCEALEGDVQKACKDKANAHMDAVKAKAAKSD